MLKLQLVCGPSGCRCDRGIIARVVCETLSVRCPCGIMSQGTSSYSKAIQGVSKPRATRAGLGEHFPEPQPEACGGSPRRGRPASVWCVAANPQPNHPKRMRARKAGRFTRRESKESQPLTPDPRIPETRRKTQELRVVRIAEEERGSLKGTPYISRLKSRKDRERGITRQIGGKQKDKAAALVDLNWRETAVPNQVWCV